MWGLVGPDTEDKKYDFVEGDVTGFVRAEYTRRMAPKGKGWSDLHLAFNQDGDEEMNDYQKMYVAGIMEGVMTAEGIRDFFMDTQFSDEARAGLAELFMPEMAFLGENSGKKSPFWHLSTAAGCQLLGIHQGYDLVRERHPEWKYPHLTLSDLMRLNQDGQIDFLVGLLPGISGNYLNNTEATMAGLAEERERHNGDRCSAVVAFTGDDLLVGHTTMETYSEQVRIMKRYEFPLLGAQAKTVVFSSYPGCISSTDDWMVGDNKLLVTETTTGPMTENNGVLREPYVPDFIHVMTAFRTAGTGAEFVQGFLNGERAITGTYNSDWMIVDYKQVVLEE